MTVSSIEKLNQISTDYTSLYLEYCDTLKEVILSNKVLEIPFVNIMNSPFYLSDKTLNETIDKLNLFSKSFGYSCLIETKNYNKNVVFKKIQKET